jgi:actin-related protein
MTESDNERVDTVDHTVYGDSSTYVISDGLEAEPEKKKRKKRATKEKLKKTKVKKLQDSHNRKSAKAAVSILEASVTKYANSTCEEALEEANNAIEECKAAAERLQQLEAQSRDETSTDKTKKRAIEEIAAKAEEANGKKAKTSTGNERNAADFKKLREKFEKMASLFGSNSARCTAATRKASEPVTAIMSALAGNAINAVAPIENREKHILELRAANGNLSAFSVDEHPILALTVGTNGNAVITTSTTAIPRLNAAAMAVDYLAYSIPRADIAPQRLASASVQKTRNAAHRLLREKKKNELALRRSIAMTQFQITNDPS